MKNKYKLLIDLKSIGLRKGMIFMWDQKENAYITKSLPWFSTPLLTRKEINKFPFKKI